MMMMMILMGLMFLSMSQPIGLIMLLILMTLFYSFYLYMIMGTFWYGLILILVVVSGVMVIFTYMVSMTPNEEFENKMVVVGLLFFVSMGVVVESLSKNSSIFSQKLWDGSVLLVNLWIVSFLMVVMLIVVWMSEFFKGAIRG